MLLSSVFLLFIRRIKKSIFKFKFNETTNKRNNIFSLSPLLFNLINNQSIISRDHLSSFFIFYPRRKYISYVC